MLSKKRKGNKQKMKAELTKTLLEAVLTLCVQASKVNGSS